jgi:RNA polymerase sigma-70 factor (ECF subfamily)
VTAIPSRADARGAEPPSDSALLVTIAQGDLGALGILYDRHARAVWRSVHRVTSGASDVDDIVHATFLLVPKIAGGFDGRPSARSWLVGIATRVALRRTRALSRFARVLGRFVHLSRDADRVDPEAHAAGRERLAVLEAAVKKLSPAKRAVFILVEMEGLTPDEVAQALGVPVPTVRTRLFHDKRALRAALAAKEKR